MTNEDLTVFPVPSCVGMGEMLYKAGLETGEVMRVESALTKTTLNMQGANYVLVDAGWFHEFLESLDPELASRLDCMLVNLDKLINLIE